MIPKIVTYTNTDTNTTTEIKLDQAWVENRL